MRANAFDLMVVHLPAAAACAATVACATGAPHVRSAGDGAQDVPVRGRPNVTAARELDRQGVRSFHDERYADATRYFLAAYRLGGPSSELWNVARSREKLDDPEGACSAIDAYLAQRDLTAQDRADADHEERALKARPSMLTVTTAPSGALVSIDGLPATGSTPLSVEVASGQHVIAVRRDGYVPDSARVEGRLGRAIIVSLDLVPSRK